MQALYPYLNGEGTGKHSGMQRNARMDAYRPSFENNINMSNFRVRGGRCGRGVCAEEFPPAVAGAPFAWDYRGTEYDMKFLGGVACIVQDPRTLALSPELSWGIVDVGLRARSTLALPPAATELKRPLPTFFVSSTEMAPSKYRRIAPP